MSFKIIEGDVTLRKSDGTETGTSAEPLRTDPTGTTPQPVTDNGGSLTVDATSLPLPTGAATETTLADIRDAAGVKKITDQLPAGTNRLGAVRLVDANDLRLDMATETTLPAGARGVLAMGRDDSNVAHFLDVRTDPLGGQNRLQIEGVVSITAPSPPPDTTPVAITFSGNLSINSTQTDNYTITNGKVFVVQQIVAGCEGDTSERGSAVEVFYFDGTTERLIERVYLNGFTTEVFPNTDTARDGTLATGNGTTRTIRIKRRRLSGSSQEVDFVVRGYEYTP